jgi:hypothetical protein
MFDRFKTEGEIQNSGRNAEIDVDDYASVSFRDMFGGEDCFFEALKSGSDDDYCVPSFP